MGADEDRFSQFLAGDEEAFRCLMRDYQGRIFAIIRGRGYRSDEADDIFQEVWLRVIEHGATFEPSLEFRHWIDAIVRNVCADHLRAGQRFQKHMREFGHAGGDGRSYGHDPLTQQPDPGAGPAQSLIHKTLGEAVAQCQEELRDEDSKTAVRLYAQGKTQREIAQLLDVSPGMVSSLFHKACRQIRRCLAHKGWNGVDAMKVLDDLVDTSKS